MAAREESLAQVRLARSLVRILELPLLLVLAGVALSVAGILLVGGAIGVAMAAAGVVLALLGIFAAAIPLSVRVHVEESVVRVRWLFGGQVHLLTAGSLTRIHLEGEGASTVSGGFGFGWKLGRAVLRGEEQIHIVRLAPTESVILIPTARGRLAIASSDEQHLIDTLTHAAQARARTEELLEVAPPPAAAEAIPQPGDPDFDPRLLTGIERALYEEWLLRRESEAITAAAAAASSAAPDAAIVEPAQQSPSALPTPAAERPSAIRRPSWARRRAVPAAEPAPTRRSRTLPIRRPRPTWLLPVVPLAAAGAAWAVGLFVGDMPASGSAVARMTALALVLAGPGTAIGTIMARTWWPRLAGVVVAAGIAASIFIGRSLLSL